MNDDDELFKRYMDEANYYATLYGLEPKTDSDGAWDAFRHATCRIPSTASPSHMDPWNNAVGRRLGEGAADNDEIAHRVHDALKKGDLIADPFQDARYYTGPTLLPSPYDYDRNHIYEGELPPPPGAPAAAGPFSPSLGINLHPYYGPLLVGGKW